MAHKIRMRFFRETEVWKEREYSANGPERWRVNGGPSLAEKEQRPWGLEGVSDAGDTSAGEERNRDLGVLFYYC